MAAVWPEADVIIGNPPFLGGSKLRRELGDTYTEQLWQAYDGYVPPAADIVTYWIEQARQAVTRGRTQRAGLLATQSIRAGASRQVLERVKQTGDIFMAWSDRPWVLDGAAVRVSMIGFDNGSEQARQLDGIGVLVIHANLTSTIDLTQAQRLHENSNLGFEGVKKTGAFEVSESQACMWLTQSSNKDVVKPWINGMDITRRPRHMWIVDFGNCSCDEAACYQAPFDYVRQHVRPERDRSCDEKLRSRWWLFERPRPAMKQALQGLSHYIVTPRVAKHRLFVFIDSGVVPDSRLNVIARSDNYFLGILQSRVHEVWSLATASRHGVGNDPTYNAQSCFETFPFPWAPGHESQSNPRVTAIATAAAHLVELRDCWLNPKDASEAELKKRTLTNLYNARPDWLAVAHRRLDEAVSDAYGWPHNLSDEQILERLLALNLERAAAQGGAVGAGAAIGENDA